MKKIQSLIPLIHFTILLILILLNSTFAQPKSFLVQQVVDSYNTFKINKTLEISTQIIESYNKFDVSDLIIVYTYRAMAYYNIGEQNEAKSAFLSALSLNPGLQLDSVTVSPKIITFFNQLKQRFKSTAGENSNPEIRYISSTDPRPAAAWRSIVLPGWGQIYKKQKLKGTIFLGTFLINTAALTTAILMESSTHNSYLDAKNEPDFDSRYSAYNSWYKGRQFFTWSQGIIWIAAFADALWYPVPERHVFSIQAQPNAIALQIRF